MRRIIASILIAGLLVILGGVAAIYAGAYDVAATEPHWPITRWIMEMARMRSIKAHAAGMTVPPGLDDPAKFPMGVEHFAAHCAVCHGAPGVPKGEIARFFIGGDTGSPRKKLKHADRLPFPAGGPGPRDKSDDAGSGRAFGGRRLTIPFFLNSGSGTWPGGYCKTTGSTRLGSLFFTLPTRALTGQQVSPAEG
jgi:mono/diheme cytochrome c family protein